MLGASWAQRQTYPLRLARSIRPRYTPARHIALSLPKPALQDGVESFLNPTYTLSIDRPRGPRYSTSISSVAEQAVALLKAKKVEEAASIVSQFPEGEANQALVLEVVDQFLDYAKGAEDYESLLAWLESFPDANNASSDVFHEIFDRLVGDGDLSLIRRFGLLCASKGYQDFVAVFVDPIVVKRLTHAEVAQWEDEIVLAAAEFKGLQRSSEGVLEEDGLDYALAPPTMAQASSVMQRIEETLPAILPATVPNGEPVFEDEGTEYITSAIPLNSDSAQSRIGKAMDELVREGRWADAHTFLEEIRGTGSFPPVRTSMFAIRTLLKILLDPTTTRSGGTKDTLRAHYLGWVRALPPALTADDVPFVKDLINTLFRQETTSSSSALETAVALSSRGYAFTIASHVIRSQCTHPGARLDIDFVIAMEEGNKEFWERYSPEIAEKRTRSVHLKLRSLAIRNLAAFGSFDQAIQFFPSASEGYLPAYDVLLRRIRAAGPDAVAKYESEVLSRIPERTNPECPPLPDGSDLAVSYNWLTNAFDAKKPPPHPMAILDFINAFRAPNPPDSDTLTHLLNKAVIAGPLHTSAFLYAEMLYYYREHNYDAVIETVKDHLHIGYGIPQAVVEAVSQQLKREKKNNGTFVENPSSYRFHDKDLLNIRQKIWAPTALCNVVWQTNAKKTHHPLHVRKQYDLLVKTIKSSKSGHQVTPKVPNANASYYPNADAFIPFLKKLVAEHGPQAGTAVINDLVRLGLHPKIAHFSELAYSYAISGASGPALTLLRKLETGFAMIKVKEKDGVPRKVPYGSPQNINTLPLVPDVHMFAHLANAFVKKGLVGEAETVFSDLEMYLKEEMEGNAYAKRVRKDLRRLKRRKEAEKQGEKSERTSW